MLASAAFMEWDTVLANMNSFSGEHTIPFPPLIILVAFVLVGAATFKLFRFRLLTRAEMLCVFYICLIGMPLMSQGFWQRYLSITTTIPRDPSMFPYMDALSDKLWPHGRNVLQGQLDQPGSKGVSASSNVTWEATEVQPGLSIEAPVFHNKNSDQVAWVRIRVPVEQDGEALIQPGEPYMITALFRSGDPPDFKISPSSQYFCRLYPDGGSRFVEAFGTNQESRITFIQKGGFVRAGVSAVNMPPAEQWVDVEFGLQGSGRVTLADPKMYNVHALQSALTGRQMVSQSEYDQLPPSERGGLVVKPDNMWSIQGVKFLLSGYIPMKQWIAPVFWWTSLILLLLLATLSMNVLLRRQWMQNERYLMPMTRIPMSLIGNGPDVEAPEGLFSRVWKNPMMWVGLAVAILWTLARGWHFYNSKVPDLSISVPLQPYFLDPGFGKMWEAVAFNVSGIFLSLAIFMEISILLSIVIGYFLFRSLWWLGESTGWVTNAAYPFDRQQQTGEYIMYALLILFFTRKYLWKVIKAAFTGDKQASEGEMFSYRTALLTLVLCFVLALLWAGYVGVSVSGMAILFGYLLIIALIATKLRTECGTPFSYLGPDKVALVLVLFGGAVTFGAEAVLFGMVLSFLLGPTPFFLIPGAQMEFAELGRRMTVRPKHLVVCAVLGVLGGMFIGGWTFLSKSYSIGGADIRYRWAYDAKSWYFTAFRSEMTQATSTYMGEGGDDDSGFWKPDYWGYAGGAVAIAIPAILRQAFPGFWFHPLGILLSSNWMAGIIWGSCLVAAVIRWVVVRLGSATTVRNKLQPFFVGVFLGCVAGHVLLFLHSAYLQSQGVERVFQWAPGVVP